MAHGGRVGAIVLFAAFLVACTAPSGPPSLVTSGGEVELVWASYQMNDEPHYRLLSEGGSDGAHPSEVRIVMPPGATVVSAPTVPSASEPLRLCGPTKTSEPRLYGPLRATLAMPEQQFKDFIRQPADFRVEAKIGDSWLPTRLTLLCHAQQ